MFISKHAEIYHIAAQRLNSLTQASFSQASKFNPKKDYYSTLGIPKDASNE